MTSVMGYGFQGQGQGAKRFRASDSLLEFLKTL